MIHKNYTLNKIPKELTGCYTIKKDKKRNNNTIFVDFFKIKEPINQVGYKNKLKRFKYKKNNLNFSFKKSIETEYNTSFEVNIKVELIINILNSKTFTISKINYSVETSHETINIDDYKLYIENEVRLKILLNYIPFNIKCESGIIMHINGFK